MKNLSQMNWFKEGSDTYGLENTQIYIKIDGDEFEVYDSVYNEDSQEWENKKIAEFYDMDSAKEFGLSLVGKHYEKGGNLSAETQEKIAKLEKVVASNMIPDEVKEKARLEIEKLRSEDKGQQDDKTLGHQDKGISAEQRDINKAALKLVQKNKINTQNEFEQVVAEALQDANYHTKAFKFAANVDKSIKTKQDWYASKRFVGNDTTKAVGIEIAQLCGWEGDKIADALEYVLRMEGFRNLADALKEVMEQEDYPNAIDELTKTQMIYVGEIAKRSSLQESAVAKFIANNGLTETETLNIFQGLGMGKLKGADLMTAVVGIPNNEYELKVVAFAKSKEAFKYEEPKKTIKFNVGDIVSYSDGYNTYQGKIKADYTDDKFYVGDKYGYQVEGFGDRLKPEQLTLVQSVSAQKPTISDKRIGDKNISDISTYVPHRVIKEITFTYKGKDFTIKGSDIFDGIYVENKVLGIKDKKTLGQKTKQPKVARTQFEEETFEFGKGGGISFDKAEIEFLTDEYSNIYLYENGKLVYKGTLPKESADKFYEKNKSKTTIKMGNGGYVKPMSNSYRIAGAYKFESNDGITYEIPITYYSQTFGEDKVDLWIDLNQEYSDGTRPQAKFGTFQTNIRGTKNLSEGKSVKVVSGKGNFIGKLTKIDKSDFNYKFYPTKMADGGKLFSVNPQIGRTKYSINTYDGKSTHKDGSHFIGIDSAKTKVAFNNLIKKYKADGYKEVPSVFNSLNKMADGGSVDSEIANINNRIYNLNELKAVSNADEQDYYDMQIAKLEKEKESLLKKSNEPAEAPKKKGWFFKQGGQTPAQTKKIEKVMHEFKMGTLKSSSGAKVTDKDQAIAIALSEAGLSKKMGKGGEVKFYLNGFEESINYILDSTDAVEVGREGSKEEGDLKIYFETQDNKMENGGGFGDMKGKRIVFGNNQEGLVVSSDMQNGSYVVQLVDGKVRGVKPNEIKSISEKTYSKGGSVDSYKFVLIEDGVKIDVANISKEKAMKIQEIISKKAKGDKNGKKYESNIFENDILIDKAIISYQTAIDIQDELNNKKSQGGWSHKK